VDAESTAVDTLQGQFSGYGSTSATVARCLDRIGLKEPLEEWSDDTIERVVQAFIDEKFPTVFALNKIDHPDADKVGSFFYSWNHAGIRAERNNLEYQQDRQDARSEVNSAMLRDIRGVSSKIGETGLHQIYRRQ
jgi:ribosome-binding ATPase YchF (GTP1/OBG family)